MFIKKLICEIVLFALTLTALFAQNAELPRLAVVEFSTNDNTAKINRDAITVRDLVEKHIQGTGKYRMISRDEIDKLLAYQQIQVSSISSTENIQKLKLENIRYIVTGSLNLMDNDYSVTVKILDVSNGVFSHIEDAFMASGSRDLYNGINDLMAKFLAGIDTKDGQVVQTGQKQATYKIGDRGPGGGLIFYAQENVYMEVSRELGKYNWSDANRAAENFKGGGFTDWRLPTIDELDKIFVVLNKNPLAGFRNDDHWSSSADVNSLFWSKAWASSPFDRRWSYWKTQKFFALAIRAF